MEYFERLGLVFRKNKERGTSPCQAADSKETRRSVECQGDRRCTKGGFDSELKNVINEPRSSTASETGHTQGLVEFCSTSSPQLKGAAVLGMNGLSISSDCTTAHYFLRQDVFVDIEYLEYEQHVKARARALKNDNLGSGGRFGWKTLIFWKRHPRADGIKSFSSTASTPLHRPFGTQLHRTGGTPGRNLQGNARRGCATVGPLYTNESPTCSVQQLSHRGWKDDGNMSPYVALSDRRQRIVSPGPLYLV